MDQRHHPTPHRSSAPAQHLTVPDRFEWTRLPGTGPAPTILGDLTGKHVVEVGCGGGHNLAHLALHHRVHAIGVDQDPAKIERARRTYGYVPGLNFVTTDALTFLKAQPPACLDLILSIFGAFSFADPAPLTAATAHALCPGGRLALTLRQNDTTDLVLILQRR